MGTSNNWIENLKLLLKSSYGGGISGGLRFLSKFLEISMPAYNSLESQFYYAPVLDYGNGSTGSGFPGERQVNNPNQDIESIPNIIQCQTSLAYYNSFILFGFNDSNGARQGNFSGFAFSSDGGLTWCDCGCMPQNLGCINGGNPVVAVDHNGVFYYSHLGITKSNQSIIQISTATVNTETKLLHVNYPFVAGIGEFPNGFQDREWIAVGPDPKADSNAEALYITWTEFPSSKGDMGIRFSKWTTGVTPCLLIPSKTIATGAAIQGSFPVVDSNGNLYVFYEDLNGEFAGLNRTICMVKSTDGGKTFSAPALVAKVTRAATDVFPCDGSLRPVLKVTNSKVVGVHDYPQAAAGPDGTLYVVWNDGRNLTTTGTDIYLAYSKDNGTTWVEEQITNTATHEFMPSITVSSKGVHIQYSRFDGNADIGTGRFALFMKNFSINEGLSKETMVSSVFSLVPDTLPNFDPACASCYLGEYNQIVKGPGESLYHCWGDYRNDSISGNNGDVFFIQTGESAISPSLLPKASIAPPPSISHSPLPIPSTEYNYNFILSNIRIINGKIDDLGFDS